MKNLDFLDWLVFIVVVLAMVGSLYMLVHAVMIGSPWWIVVPVGAFLAIVYVYVRNTWAAIFRGERSKR